MSGREIINRSEVKQDWGDRKERRESKEGGGGWIKSKGKMKIHLRIDEATAGRRDMHIR
jgi:hypothetical protein